MELVTLPDEGLGNQSYLVDLGDGAALVIDPQRDARPYVAAAERRGLTIRFAAETHLHADFVSGGRELQALGAGLITPAEAQVRFAATGVEDGETVELGGLTLQAIATPGHTPEHLSYLLLDGAVPVALFSGGTLMAGGVARPDLIAPDQTEPLARAAYRSIVERLLRLPDDLAVYPTHGGGSFCSAAAATGGTTATTIGVERATNPLLQAPDEDTFVAQLLGGLGTYPPYFLRLRGVNQAGAALLGTDPPRLPLLDATAVAAAMADGAVVVDARATTDFAAGHIPGAISIELRPQFATWLGWLVPFGSPIVLVVADDQDESELVRQARGIGYDRLLGRADTAAWPHPLAATPLVTAVEESAGRSLLDVRQDSEWEQEHVPGALHIELGALPGAAADVAGPLLVHCAHGQRSMTAASILQRAGHQDVAATALSPADLARAQPVAG